MTIEKKRMKLIVRFRLRKSHKNSKLAYHYIYVRLIVNGVEANGDFTTGIRVEANKFEYKRNPKIAGRSETTQADNNTLDRIEAEIKALFNSLIDKGKTVTANTLKAAYLKIKLPVPNLFEAYQRYITEEISGSNQFDKDSIGLWETCLRNLKGYVLTTYNRTSIDLEEADKTFGERFRRYLLGKYGGSHGCRNLNYLKAVLRWCAVNEWIDKATFDHLKIAKTPPKEPLFLTEKQLGLLQALALPERLQRVVDCFLFQSFTGLAYTDLRQFRTSKHLIVRPSGMKTIYLRRGKSKVESIIPLLPVPKMLLQKYGESLPVISNQKYNEYLHELSPLIDFTDNLTTHVGRKTAGMYLLNNAVSMEVVSRILGHKSIKTTERIYARVLHERIEKEMQHLIQ